MQQRNSKQSSMLMQEIMLKTDILLLEIWFCSEKEERTDCLQHMSLVRFVGTMETR